MVRLLGKLREKYQAAMQPIGRWLGRLGVSPNSITTVSVLVSFLAGAAYALKLPIIGALGLLLSGFIDMLDGAVARATGRVSRFGAVYDHVLDRYAEFAVLIGIGLGGLVDWIWIVFCLFGMVMASYTRAKAESVGGLTSCTVGFAERQEKIILLLIGSLIQPFFPLGLMIAVIIVGILSHITVVQRLHYTFKNTRGPNVAV
jgi:CDP-diacylglycerol--glycerol-3-phosphate 3-phosphatidyltransferase/archaetidylinositol phosphate synthase